jgi:hypothetical protein
MACPDLAIEILRNHLTHCYYVTVYCPHDGEVRAAISDVPVHRFLACPVCHEDCEYRVLGEGGTAQSLPFWDDVRSRYGHEADNEAFWRLMKRRAS